MSENAIRPSGHKGRKRNELDSIAMRNGFACRVVDKSVTPDCRRKHARALVTKQIQSSRRILSDTQKLTAFIGPGPSEMGREGYGLRSKCNSPL